MNRALPALATLLAVTTLSACGDDEPARGSGEYVALGDSYTAAPGNGPAEGVGSCFRSGNNYPHQVAKAADLELTDVSCTSATSEAVTGEQTTPQGDKLPPQLDAVTAATEVVTVGIGANDFDLIGRVILSCAQLGAVQPTGQPCTDVDKAAGVNSVAHRVADVRERLEDVLEAIARRAPEARILVVGYPQIFPEGEGCALLPLPSGDLDYARGVVDGLNDALSSAAEAADAEYVDVFTATRGHDICSDDPWIAGASVLAGAAATPWHPYPDEQKAVAEQVLAALDR